MSARVISNDDLNFRWSNWQHPNSGVPDCVRCGTPLGRVFNRGAVCPGCGERVCRACRSYAQTAFSLWRCVDCCSRSDPRLSTSDFLYEFSRINAKYSTDDKPEQRFTRSVRRSSSVIHPNDSPQVEQRCTEFRPYASLPHGYDANSSVYLRSLNERNAPKHQNTTKHNTKKKREQTNESETINDTDNHSSANVDLENENSQLINKEENKEKSETNDVVQEKTSALKIVEKDEIPRDTVKQTRKNSKQDCKNTKNQKSPNDEIAKQERNETVANDTKPKKNSGVVVENKTQQTSPSKSKSSKRNARRKRFNSLSPTRTDNLKKHVQGRRKNGGNSRGTTRFTSRSDPNTENPSEFDEDIPAELMIGGQNDTEKMPEWAKIILKSNEFPSAPKCDSDDNYCASSSDDTKVLDGEVKHRRFLTVNKNSLNFDESDDNCSVSTASPEGIKVLKNLAARFDDLNLGSITDVDSDSVSGLECPVNLNFASESMEDLPFCAEALDDRLDDERLDAIGFKKVLVKDAEHVEVSVPTTPTASHSNRRIRTISSDINAPSTYNRLVFLTSSDSSSKEEDFDNDCECDWDYFEPPPSSTHLPDVPPSAETPIENPQTEQENIIKPPEETVEPRAIVSTTGGTDCCQSCGSQPRYVPVPIPVPVPVPVPWFGPRESLQLFRNAVPRNFATFDPWMWTGTPFMSSQYAGGTVFGGWQNGLERSAMYNGQRMPLISQSLAFPGALSQYEQFAGFADENQAGLGIELNPPPIVPVNIEVVSTNNEVSVQPTKEQQIKQQPIIKQPIIKQAIKEQPKQEQVLSMTSSAAVVPTTTTAEQSRVVSVASGDVVSGALSDESAVSGSNEARRLAMVAEPLPSSGNDEPDEAPHIIEVEALPQVHSHLACENEGSSSESEISDDENISENPVKNISRSYDVTATFSDLTEDSDASDSDSSDDENGERFSKVFTVNPGDSSDASDVSDSADESEVARLCFRDEEEEENSDSGGIVLLSCTSDGSALSPPSLPPTPAQDRSGGTAVDGTGVSQTSPVSLSPNANGNSTNTENTNANNVNNNACGNGGAKYKSLVMITQSEVTDAVTGGHVSVVTSDTTTLAESVTVHHTNRVDNLDSAEDEAMKISAKEDALVRVVTGGDTLSAVVCLEEGLADDDSWVEDVGSHDDEDEFATTTETDSGGEEALMAMIVSQQSDREEELRGYHRAAIDFTLHTIAEESCEESETECRKPVTKQRPLSSSELEKYFFFGLCGDAGHSLGQSGLMSGNSVNSAGLDEASETSSVYSEGVDSLGPEEEENVADNEAEEESAERLASSRLEKYFLTGFMGFTERRESDGSGSVGSDSEGRPSPEQRRKRLVRARGTGRSSHSSSLDNLLAEQNAELVQQQQQQLLVTAATELSQQIALSASQDSSSETDANGEDGALTFEKSDGFDTVKRKQKHCKKQKQQVLDNVDESNMGAAGEDCENQQQEDDDTGSRTPQPEFLHMTPSDLASSRSKQHSRDSGFIGSCDDLLKEQRGSSAHADETGVVNKIEQLAEIAEENSSRPEEVDGKLSRKDSFNNWSSDEETNMMMCKMRQFFKTMVNGRGPSGAAHNSQNNAQSSKSTKSPQLLYFESELTRLMKTVPGIREDQVREIVEYLSSEDTWSDSCDSSDYTSSDLEGAMDRTALRRQISDSCRRIISKFDVNATNASGVEDEEGDAGDGGVAEEARCLNRETAFVYQKLVASFGRTANGEEILNKPIPIEHNAIDDSPPLIAKVMHHIGSRLVALMQEVSSSGGESHTSGSPRISKHHHHHHHHHRRTQQQKPSSTEEEEDDGPEPPLPMPRSKSHDPLLADPVPTDEREASDYERFSWRGSFESALMTGADSRTKLSLLSGGDNSVSTSAVALAAKRRSAGDLLFGRRSPSRERLDRVRSCGSIGRAAADWSGSDDVETNSGRRASVPDSACGSSDNDEDTEASSGTKRSTTLPRSLIQPAAQQQTAGTSNSLPRAHQFLQNHVKSARYRAPGFGAGRASAPKRAVSAPGLQQAPPPRREARRRMQAQQLIAQDDSSISANSSPLVRLRSGQLGGSGGSAHDWGNGTQNHQDEDVDRLMRLHSNRSLSSLGLRSDSMASVYSGAGDGRYGTVTVKGEVEFGLQYNYKTNALMIRIRQCRDLAQVDAKRSRSDPYVKVYLLPDKSKSGKRKTKVKKHTVNPVFEETLSFNLSLDELKTRTLWLTVWHSDMFGRNDFLGEVMMPLEDKVFDDPTPVWYQLQERTEPFEEINSNKGDIILALKFVPPDMSSSRKSKKSRGALHVLVKEAKNLVAAKASGTSDPFCKSYLLPDKGRSSKQKTPVLRRCLNPAWNYTFVYEDVTLQDLTERALELTVWDHDRLGSNEFLGMIRLSLGTGKYQEKSVDWMDAYDKEVSLWQSMLNRPNFWVESCISLRTSINSNKT